MSDCPACTTAHHDPDCGLWENGCFGCQARAFAAFGFHLESAERGALTAQYRNGLEKVFGSRWKEAHEAVKAWGQKITAAARQKGVR